MNITPDQKKLLDGVLKRALSVKCYNSFPKRLERAIIALGACKISGSIDPKNNGNRAFTDAEIQNYLLRVAKGELGVTAESGLVENILSGQEELRAAAAISRGKARARRAPRKFGKFKPKN